jgi:hypothetical protein
MRNITKSPGASSPRGFAPPSLNPGPVVTIRMQEVCRSLSANYTRLLREIVFTQSTTQGERNRKMLRSFKRVLAADEANTVLNILWRESDYVTEDELSYDGFIKLFGEHPLTSYHLAVYLAGDKTEVAATNSRVRSIVAAGVEFGLVEKRQSTRTKVHIFGTELLHNFMLRLGLENANTCMKILWQDREARIAPELFSGVSLLH